MSTPIWQNDGQGWQLASPEPYENESVLESLVEDVPKMVPLSGTPELIVVGRQVALGALSADLIAVEAPGRLVVIEVKLKRSPEARRAVVAQVLTYAAALDGETIESLERGVFAAHLSKRGQATLAELVKAQDQVSSFDPGLFEQELQRNLTDGRFRLVLILDEVPDELVRLTGYLGRIADKVVVDLIAVSAYQIGGAQVLVPQRVDPEHHKAQSVQISATAADDGRLVEGWQDFSDAIKQAKPEQQPTLRTLLEWAKTLEEVKGVRLQTYHGKNNIVTLLPRLRADNAGLVTIWRDDSGAQLVFYRSVFDRRAPKSIQSVETALGEPLRKGNATRSINDELLAALTDAYREAALGYVRSPE